MPWQQCYSGTKADSLLPLAMSTHLLPLIVCMKSPPPLPYPPFLPPPYLPPYLPPFSRLASLRSRRGAGPAPP